MNLGSQPDIRCAPPELATRATNLIRADVTMTSESHFFAGLRGDPTRGGVFVATYREERVGDAILVELMVDDRCVVAKGTVRWRTPGGTDLPPGLGIALHELTEADRRVIEGFCRKRPPFYFDVGDRASIV